MKKSNALSLVLCAMLSSACSPKVEIKEAPPLIINEVPISLLQCEPEPQKPSFRTGSNKKDFQNMTTYAAQVKKAGADCRGKLEKTKSIIRQHQKNQGDPS